MRGCDYLLANGANIDHDEFEEGSAAYLSRCAVEFLFINTGETV